MSELDLPAWVTSNVRIIDLSDRATWERERFNGLGASDASTVFGVNPYQDEYTLWAIKTGRMKPKLPTRTLKYGQINEQIVREAYEEDTGTTVWHRPNFMFMHETEDCLRYSPDGLVNELPRLFEAKTAKRNNEWVNEASDHAEAQVYTGMTVLGIPGVDADIQLMLAGDAENMERFTIPYNQTFIDTVFETLVRWWHDHVVKDVAPIPDHRALNFLLEEHAESIPGSVLHVEKEQRREVLDALEQFKKGRSMVAKGEKIRDAGRARLVRIAGDYETVETTTGKELFTNRPHTVRRLSKGALLRAGLNPEDYKEETTVRSLRTN